MDDYDDMPPESGRYEEAFLGACFCALTSAEILEIERRLPASCFHIPAHQHIWRAVCAEAAHLPQEATPLPYDVAVRCWDRAHGNYRLLVRMMLEIGARTNAEIECCVERIVTLAAQRRRWSAALAIAKLCCDPFLSLEEIDRKSNYLMRAAREGLDTSSATGVR